MAMMAACGVPVANSGLNCGQNTPIGCLKNEQHQSVFGCQFGIRIRALFELLGRDLSQFKCLYFAFFCSENVHIWAQF